MDSYLSFQDWLISHSIISSGHLGYSHLFAIVNNAALNLDIQESFHIPAFNFSEYICRIRIAESYGKSMFNFLSNCHTVTPSLYIPTNCAQRFYMRLSLLHGLGLIHLYSQLEVTSDSVFLAPARPLTFQNTLGASLEMWFAPTTLLSSSRSLWFLAGAHLWHPWLTHSFVWGW